MKVLCSLFAALSLAGCATLERHPVLTAVGTAIIVGSIAATIEQRHDQPQFNRTIMPSRGPQCRNGVCGP